MVLVRRRPALSSHAGRRTCRAVGGEASAPTPSSSPSPSTAPPRPIPWIMHALLTEAESRGCTVETRTDLRRGEAVHAPAIVIRGRAFPLVLTERTAKVPHEPTPQELRRRERSPWTRLPKYDEEFGGRLVLGAPAGSRCQHSCSYSDGARWTLESRLGHLLQDLELLAPKAERRDREKELREAEQRRRWYAAVALAREQQIEQHRATVPTGAGAGLAAGRRDPRLLPGRPCPSLRRTGSGGRGGPAGVGRGACGTTRPAPGHLAHSAGSTARAGGIA